MSMVRVYKTYVDTEIPAADLGSIRAAVLLLNRQPRAEGHKVGVSRRHGEPRT